MFFLTSIREALRDVWAGRVLLSPVCSRATAEPPGRPVMAVVQPPSNRSLNKDESTTRTPPTDFLMTLLDRRMTPTPQESASARKLRDLFAAPKPTPSLPEGAPDNKAYWDNNGGGSTTTASHSSNVHFAISPKAIHNDDNTLADPEPEPIELALVQDDKRQPQTINENAPTTDFSSVKPQSRRKPNASDFMLLKVLGKGSYGTVMLVRSNLDNGIYAMKMLRKDQVVRRHQVQHTRTERAVLESIRHPFIVELYFAFQTPKKLYFVMEYCPGGELFFHLSRANRFSEHRVRFYICEIVLALEFLHKLNIVYRDLKPENVLLDAEGHVRLTDFGLSKGDIADNFSTKSLCGTPEYLAPEILNQQGHGKAVDWWSLGALIYEMLTGLPPFYSKDRERLFDNIKGAELIYPAYVSSTAKDLLVRLFNRNPDQRLGGGKADAQEIKGHPFFAGVNWDDVYNKRITPPFKPTLRSTTDVQNFAREFIKLPAVNSEAAVDCALAAGAGGDAAKDDMFPGFTYDLREQK